jgi:thermostable 8-oxoguanine DNA glycosylase
MWSPFNKAEKKKLEEELIVTVASAQTSADSLYKAMRELEAAIQQIRKKQHDQ